MCGYVEQLPVLPTDAYEWNGKVIVMLPNPVDVLVHEANLCPIMQCFQDNGDCWKNEHYFSHTRRCVHSVSTSPQAGNKLCNFNNARSSHQAPLYDTDRHGATLSLLCADCMIKTELQPRTARKNMTVISVGWQVDVDHSGRPTVRWWFQISYAHKVTVLEPRPKPLLLCY